MITLEGVIPVLPAPFDAGGGIDLAGFRRVVEYAIRNGARAVAMFGLASEFYKLTDEERLRYLDAALDAASGAVPVVISVTHHSTEPAIEQARSAAARGADALMVLPPFFLNPPLTAVLDHIASVAAAVPLPIIVQWAPAQTGTAFRMEELAGLPARQANVQYVKVDACPAAELVREISQTTALRSIVGYMGLDLVEALAAGCSGCMPTVSVTPVLSRVYSLARSDLASARKLHIEILPLLQFLMQSVEFLIACEKHILLRQGLIASAYCRRPGAALDAERTAELDSLLQSIEGIE